MANSLQRLPELERQLSRKYPGIQVRAEVRQSGDQQPLRNVEFIGPRSLLIDFGLLPPTGEVDHESIDEYGTHLHACPDMQGTAIVWRVLHQHRVDTGAEHGTHSPRSNPDNIKTRAMVARLLRRLGTCCG
jgi:hypothetical protein